ncbi:uncharacterized protein LOC124850789 isoform X8 [Xyrichtys novacula]|uniref:Uncharacterized protein LOC124850789 isoform X8 n=1 Tax=Xyrichtys novacula TaxID=13765 RepID=A0AAV1H7B0_XYRNO|nr:uncharacterized protein LOC124850789 isoform X8 [Xyrichtys novacula]
MHRKRRVSPKTEAKLYVSTKRDKAGLDVKYINSFKGRGIFTSAPFEKGDFLLEYRGDLISQQECERRLHLYHDHLKAFMFEFRYNGKLWCVDAAQEDGSLGRLVNDDHKAPNAKMKYLHMEGKPHLCLFAARDISPGEEITYNYGDSDWPWRHKMLMQETESNLTPISLSFPNQTLKSPAMAPLNQHEESPDKDKPHKLSEVTDLESTAAGAKECKKHQLVSANVSTLEKCIQCVGPVSSLRWTGYQCRVCSGVWHKSCLRRITDGDLHGLLEYSGKELLADENSSSEDSLSDKDYIPDSESLEEDHDDSDASLPLAENPKKAVQQKKKPVLPDILASCALDLSSMAVQNTPHSYQPYNDDVAEELDSVKSVKDSSKDKTEGGAEFDNQEVPHLTMSIKNYCFICGKPQSKISRHLRTHKAHPEIVHAFSLPEDSKKRKILVERMRNKGNFRHNTTVLQSGTGVLKAKRAPKAKAQTGHFIHCMYCQGMYIRKELWRHVRRCPFKPENEDTEKEPGRTKVLSLAAAQETAFSQHISSGVWKLLGSMKEDEVASTVRNDLTIIQLAQSLFNKHGQDPTKFEYMRQKLREAVCDSSGKFLDTYVGNTGSMHDVLVLRRSSMYKESLYPSAGYVLLGVGGYPCLRHPVTIITPYHQPLAGCVEEHFNQHHARARNVVKQALGMLKTRWRAIFLQALEIPSVFAPKVVTACCILHNLCLATGDIPEEKHHEDD